MLTRQPNAPVHHFRAVSSPLRRSLQVLTGGIVALGLFSHLSLAQAQTGLGGTAASGFSAAMAQTGATAQQGANGATALPAGMDGLNTPAAKLAAQTNADAPDLKDTQPAKQQPLKPQTPSQFQRFVQESTGRLLPIFGTELFSNSQVNTPDTSLPAPAEYILGPGDEVRVQVWGAIDYSGSHTLDRNGQINLPKVGTFALAGVPVRDLEAVLRGQIGKVFTNFSVNAGLGRLRSIQVYVVGQVRQPGSYKLSSLSTLINALFVGGGPTTNGSMRNIQLTRAGKVVATLDLYDLIARGDKGRDLPLQSGDVIVVPPVGPRVAVAGALDQAAIYELKDAQTTLADILAFSGGVPALASTQKALLERIDPASTVPRKVQELSLDSQGLKTRLADGDVVTLLGISSAFSNAVTLQGNVAAPLRYKWFSGMRVSDLIPEVDALITPDYYLRKNLLVQEVQTNKAAGAGLNSRLRTSLDQINWDYAVIERLNRQSLTIDLIPFNLGMVVMGKDEANNLALQPGDVVTVMAQSDLRLPQDRLSRLVRVEGEVAVPGIYQALPGETLPQLLRRIGGLTPQAYVFGTEFTRESVRQRQQENLEILIRRLEAQAQAQTSTLASNIKSENAAQAQALLQQQQVQLRGQIDRLRVMRSSGRMALELDASGQSIAAFPSLPLEDGDHILVPSVPGFVSAYGSVNNENVFLYKPGKTVADIIKSAGLTIDADPDQAFVLRADGSVSARRDRSGLFGGNFESMPVMPGDTLIVPAQVDRETGYNFTVRALKDWTQILSNLGIGAAAIKSLRN